MRYAYAINASWDASQKTNPDDVMMSLGDIIRQYYKRGLLSLFTIENTDFKLSTSVLLCLR